MTTDVHLRDRHLLQRGPTFLRRTSRTTGLSDIEKQYIEATTGQDPESEEILVAAEAHIRHLRSIIRDKWLPAWDSVCVSPDNSSNNPYTAVLQLGTHIADYVRSNASSSISRIIAHMQTSHIFRQDQNDSNLREDRDAQQLVFSIIGWLSMLYTPAKPLVRDPGSNNFRIVVRTTKSGVKSVIPADKASRPMDELLRAMGDLLPSKRDQNLSYRPRAKFQEHLETKFLVSYLNVNTLKTLGQINIRWVDDVSSHLDFDPNEPCLSIFRCPSFCILQQSDNSLLSCLLKDLYDEDEHEAFIFNAQKLMNEIQQSYKLLFGDDQSSRKLFSSHERARAGFNDAVLDQLCGKNRQRTYWSLAPSVRDSYDVEADFPILKERLMRVQNFMQDIQPNRFLSLWRDRRDLRLWYTIWTVIILGVIGVAAQLAGIALAAAQVKLAQQAYNLQRAQVP